MSKCTICDKKIDENKDTYEITEVWIDGNYDDTYHVHTDCRVKQIIRSVEND